MIPSLLLVALVLGTLIHDRASLRRSVAVGAAISLFWGVVVGVGDASATTAAGGTALRLRTFSWARQSGAAVGANLAR